MLGALVLASMCALAAAAGSGRIVITDSIVAPVTTGYDAIPGGAGQIWAEVNATAFLNIPEGFEASIVEESWPMPATSEQPSRHVFFATNPTGHPATDGYQNGGGYGVAHVDLHFFHITAEERREKAVCSSFPPCPMDNTSAAIYSYPPSAVIAEDFYLASTYGGHGVPGHGMHWLPKFDQAIDTPLGTGTEVVPGPPNWLPCLLQSIPPFEDQGCRLADWYPGLSPILITLDGKTVAYEAMMSKQFVRRLMSGMIPNPYTSGFPQVRRRIIDVSPPKYPYRIISEYFPERDAVRFTMDLDNYAAAKCPKSCATCDENFLCTSCKLDARKIGILNNECVNCKKQGLAPVNGVCHEPQSCLWSGGAFCRADDGECATYSNGETIPCGVPAGCAAVNENCAACTFNLRRPKCTACADGYSLDNKNRCKPN